MDHVCAELVVTFELLFFKVALDDRFIREEDFGDLTCVGSFHDQVFTHERISTSETDDCSCSSFDGIINLSDWHEVLFGDESNGTSFSVRSFLL